MNWSHRKETITPQTIKLCFSGNYAAIIFFFFFFTNNGILQQSPQIPAPKFFCTSDTCIPFSLSGLKWHSYIELHQRSGKCLHLFASEILILTNFLDTWKMATCKLCHTKVYQWVLSPWKWGLCQIHREIRST